ncbi:hypothetical protein [Paenibacillus kobensis]|uniref:hypothetical protein n=1 Tax=Paenibacillus kobensis TaxID=59841 RepID=UPI000FD97DDB|nr:hypothetical protein [Paenibacillus kobensis]
MRTNYSRLARGLVLLLGISVVSSGCSSYKYEPHGYKSNTYSTRNAGQPRELDKRQFGTLSVGQGNHDNQYFEYSSQISKEISKIDGISYANVMLTDRNAYVGLVFHGTAIRTKSGGRDKQEQNVGGANEGVYNHTTGSPYWDGRELATPYGSAFTVNDHNEIPDGLKQAVALRVRKLAPRVKEVHISANREFVNRLLEYAKKSWMNESLEPYLEDFNALVAHQFAGSDKRPASIRHINPKTTGIDRNTGDKDGPNGEPKSGADKGDTR